MTPMMIGLTLVVLSTLVDGFGQTLLKRSSVETLRRRFWIAWGLCFLILDAVFYSGALWFLAVSMAFPISSLSFITATVFSKWLLREEVTPIRWTGVVLILVGTSLIVTYSEA